MDSVLIDIKQAVREGRLLHSKDLALVMLSGGGDSVALLRALVELQPELELTLHALHINHMIRGEDAEKDEAFVRELCATLDVPLEVVRVDVPALAAELGLNLEDAGRQVRYEKANELLERLVIETGAMPAFYGESAGKIITAHTLDDRVETFFARAISGSGTGALGSIRIKRGNIIRPLLGIDRKTLREWLIARGQEWREDPSNEDESRTRAFIRARIVPACEELNPSFRTSLERTMDIVDADDNILSNMASMFARDFVDDRLEDSHVTFNLNFMRTLDPAMAKRTLRQGIIDTFPEASRLDYEHITRLIESFDRESYVQDLPGMLRATVRYDTLKVAKKRASEVWEDVLVSGEGSFDLGAAGVLNVTSCGPEIIRGNANIAVVDAEVFLGTTNVGAARTGERIVPLGMEGSKLISDIFIDAKTPVEARSLVPIVRDGQLVVWVAGHTLSDLYKVTEKTERAWCVEWVPRSNH